MSSKKTTCSVFCREKNADGAWTVRELFGDFDLNDLILFYMQTLVNDEVQYFVADNKTMTGEKALIIISQLRQFGRSPHTVRL